MGCGCQTQAFTTTGTYGADVVQEGVNSGWPPWVAMVVSRADIRDLLSLVVDTHGRQTSLRTRAGTATMYYGAGGELSGPWRLGRPMLPGSSSGTVANANIIDGETSGNQPGVTTDGTDSWSCWLWDPFVCTMIASYDLEMGARCVEALASARTQHQKAYGQDPILCFVFACGWIHSGSGPMEKFCLALCFDLLGLPRG